MKRFQDLSQYVSFFLQLIEKERDAEKEFHLNEIKTLSPRERERRGRALLHMLPKKLGKKIESYELVRFYKSEKFLPGHEFQVGDWVLVTEKERPDEKSPQAMVYELSRYALTLAFPDKPPRFRKKRPLRIDLFVNDITFQRMKDALLFLKRNPDNVFVPYLLGNKKIKKTSNNVVESLQPRLNRTQQEAVNHLLTNEEKIGLIHGPPGTGKTTTLIALIEQFVKQGKSILATADSNNATDNLLEGLLSKNIKVVRVGNPVRLDPKLKEHSLDYKIRNHKDYKFIENAYKKINKLIENRDRYLRPSPGLKRGLSDNTILEIAEAGGATRGLTQKQIAKMAKWISLNNEVKAEYENIKNLEQEIKKEILAAADVVCATNSTSATIERKFDIGIIDEATQSTEPSCLIPLTKVKKIVLAGDDKQLPPTVIAYEVQKHLSLSLFERWHKCYPELTHLLRIQYRMHPTIMQFPNEQFYNGKLVAAESIRKRLFPYTFLYSEKAYDYSIFAQDIQIVFLNVSPKSAEQKGEHSFSYYNPKEARIIKHLIEAIKENNIPLSEVGIISPYGAQTALLRKQFSKDENLEIKTIDGFQGREKEIIIISFVRNNPEGNLGFLKDYRRLNVALTRAKTKLILIGNENTLRRDRLYERLLEQIRQKGYFYNFN